MIKLLDIDIQEDLFMFNGKMKALTFSYDDGVDQDKRLIEIFNKYGLKCTFNLNSDLLGRREDTLNMGGKIVNHHKAFASDVRHIYEGHEVAAHTLTHPFLPNIEDDCEIIRQVEEDRLKLSELCGYEVIGMAYPCGGQNHDDRVANIIREVKKECVPKKKRRVLKLMKKAKINTLHIVCSLIGFRRKRKS